MIDVQGEALVMERVARELPDWRTMRGIAEGGEAHERAALKC